MASLACAHPLPGAPNSPGKACPAAKPGAFFNCALPRRNGPAARLFGGAFLLQSNGRFGTPASAFPRRHHARAAPLLPASASAGASGLPLDGEGSTAGEPPPDGRARRDGFVFGRGPPGAWDSGGVGRPVVRRYLNREQDTWLMWYEGWKNPEDAGASEQTAAGADGGEGVPASCVGLALSANGLIWVRGEDAVETDARGRGGAGMVLKPSANWWSFDTRHVKPSDVIMMASPKVRASSGVLWMFYEGHSHEHVELPDAVSPAVREQLAPSRAVAHGGGDGDGDGSGGTTTVLRSRPGLAMSNDGRNWAAIEGEHHSGAVLDVGAEGEWDRVSIGAPHVVFHSPGDLRMYYHALDPDTGRFDIGMARSRDGIKWMKLGKVFGAESSSTALGCLKAQVVANPGFEGIEKDSYVMVFERLDKDGRSSIGLAVSDDGLSNWTYLRDILRPSEDGTAWDSVAVCSPCLVTVEMGTVRLYYDGKGPDAERAIGVAEAETGSLDFVRQTTIMLSM